MEIGHIEKEKARIAITVAFFCLSITSAAKMLSIIGKFDTNNFAHGQTNKTASIATNQFDGY